MGDIQVNREEIENLVNQVPKICENYDGVIYFYNTVEKNIALAGYREYVDYMEKHLDEYRTWVPNIVITYEVSAPHKAEYAKRAIIRLFLLLALLNNQNLVRSVKDDMKTEQDLRELAKQRSE